MDLNWLSFSDRGANLPFAEEDVFFFFIFLFHTVILSARG
jgi:hypothetical protein